MPLIIRQGGAGGTRGRLLFKVKGRILRYAYHIVCKYCTYVIFFFVDHRPLDSSPSRRRCGISSSPSAGTRHMPMHLPHSPVHPFPLRVEGVGRLDTEQLSYGT